MVPRVSHPTALLQFLRIARWRSSTTRTLVGGGLLLAGVVAVFEAFAGPLLHEHFEPDPVEDRRLSATNSRGTMPAWLETKSGWVSAPDPIDGPADRKPGAAMYGGAKNTASEAAEFVLDNLTTRPSRVEYDEPFRPSIIPYKRLYAYDRVAPNFALDVADPSPREKLLSARAELTEDAFFGDFEVDLVPSVAVRIPSPGPSSKVLAVVVDPPRPVVLSIDSAENWFVRAEQGGRVRMYLQLSVPRQAFGSQFLPVGRAALEPYLVPMPEHVRSAAERVLSHVGVAEETVPAAALKRLVNYFRGFHESDQLPQAAGPGELYQEMSLTQKGVCRHRAYAFVVTALAWGLPSRLVHNEAHAWVEVFDSELWHRVDLGGAASELQLADEELTTVRHRPPSDPFAWPNQERAASVEFERRLNHRGIRDLETQSSGAWSGFTPAPRAPGSAPGSGLSSSNSRAVAAPDRPSLFSQPASSVPEPEVDLPELDLEVEHTTYVRGTPLSVRGTATRGAVPCALSRIDLFVTFPDQTEPSMTIGSLATDHSGRFSGQVTLPNTLPVGRVKVGARLGAGCSTR